MQVLRNLRQWTATPIQVTRGWILISVFIAWLFLSIAIYAAVQTVRLDNRVTQDQVEGALVQQVNTCTIQNQRRIESKFVALATLNEDRRIWEFIELSLRDAYTDEIRMVVERRLEDRRDQIEETFTIVDCSVIMDVISP